MKTALDIKEKARADGQRLNTMNCINGLDNHTTKVISPAFSREPRIIHLLIGFMYKPSYQSGPEGFGVKHPLISYPFFIGLDNDGRMLNSSRDYLNWRK